METFVDIAFPVLGKELPLDHAYALFAALSRLLPGLHQRDAWGVHPVRGVRSTRDLLSLDRQSFVKLRMPVEDVKHVLALAGAKLDVDGHAVNLGVPRLFPLVPAASLKARIVTVKGHSDSEAALLDSCRRKLAHLELGQDPERIEVRIGRPRPRQPLRLRPVLLVVMPFGVEHKAHTKAHRRTVVLLVVMPFGVEHRELGRPDPRGNVVLLVVMPFGVEHCSASDRTSRTSGCSSS